MIVRTLTVLFSVFLILIIAWANSGGHGAVFEFVLSKPHGDKIAHFCLVGTLALLINLSLRNRRFELLGHRMLVGSWLVFSLATLEELSQVFVANRNCSLADWLANTLGIFLLGSWVAERLGPKGEREDG